MRPSLEQLDAVYQRLLAHEPDAPSDLIELVLDPLIDVLRKRFPTLPDPDLIVDVVTDALLQFVQEPQRYQPHRGNLWTYLHMDALGDLHNAWNKEQRRNRKVVPFDLVAHDRPDRNTKVEELVMQRLVPVTIPEGITIEELVEDLRTDIPDPRDWQVVLLMANGERRTSTFATALGITDLPDAEQRKRVKQAKDRLRLRLKRRGVKLNEA